MSPRPHLDLSRRERQIIDILYSHGRSTAAEVQSALPDPPSYSAVRAMLRILEEKGHVRHEQDGPRYVYLPTLARDNAKHSALRHVLTTFFDGSAEQAISALRRLLGDATLIETVPRRGYRFTAAVTKSVHRETDESLMALLAPHSADLQQRLAVLERRLQLCMRQHLHREQLRLEGLLRRLRHPGERVQQLALRVDDLERRLHQALQRRLGQSRERLLRLEHRLASRHPGRQLALLRQRLDSLAERLPRATLAGLRQRRLQLAALAQTLQVVSPLATLGRGYSILLDEQGHAIRDARQTHVGQRLEARLGEGRLSVRVEDNHQEPVNLSLLD